MKPATPCQLPSRRTEGQKTLKRKRNRDPYQSKPQREEQGGTGKHAKKAKNKLDGADLDPNCKHGNTTRLALQEREKPGKTAWKIFDEAAYCSGSDEIVSYFRHSFASTRKTANLFV